ncbi:MAG TPA: GntR family transcriptional regulator [Chitinophagaceae bacterium]
MEKLLRLGFVENTPKYLQIADSIIEAIREGDLKKGEQIPSINELSEEYLLSRDTVEKAYKQLRDKGIIISVKGKGYFINRTNVNAAIRVLLVFNKISNYKKQVYNAFVNTMGQQAVVDLHIHHFNTQVFKSLIANHLGDYDYYVVMPHFYEHMEDAIQVIKEIPPGKLILLDKDIPEIGHNYAAVYQDFERDISDALHEAIDLLRKYNQLIFVNPNLVPYPPEIVKGFRYFCRMNDFDFNILREIDINTPVQRNAAYIVIEEMDLVNLIKDCKNRGLIIGKDIGIISYNDTPLKEILLQGITVISTNHEKMGETAARMILEKDMRQIKNPFSLIRRASL